MYSEDKVEDSKKNQKQSVFSQLVKLIETEAFVVQRWPFLETVFYRFPKPDKKASDCDIVFFCNGSSLDNCETLVCDLRQILLENLPNEPIYTFPTFRLQSFYVMEATEFLWHLTIYHSIDSALSHDGPLLLNNFSKVFSVINGSKCIELNSQRTFTDDKRLLYFLCQLWIETRVIQEFELFSEVFWVTECQHKYEYILKVLNTSELFMPYVQSACKEVCFTFKDLACYTRDMLNVLLGET